MTLLYVNNSLVDLGGAIVSMTIRGLVIGNLTDRFCTITNKFKVPDTEANLVIFGFTNSEKSYSTIPYSIQSAKLVFNGSEFKGYVLVNKYDEGLMIEFVDDTFNGFNSINNLSLADVTPIANSAWTEEEMDSNRATTSGLISAILWWGTGVNIFSPNLYLPSFYYHSLIDAVLDYMGLTAEGDILTDARLTDLVVPFPGSTFTRLNAVDAPAFISKGSAGATTGSSFNFSYPNDIQEYDLLFLHVVSYGLGTITVDASWTSLGALTYPTVGPVFVSRLYYKMADGTETGTENVSRSGHSGTDTFMGQVYQYRGDQYGPDSNISIEDSDNQNGNAATITWAATTVSGGKRTLAAFVVNVSGSDPGTPSGYTNSATDNNGSNTYLDLNTKADTSSGASTTATNGSTNGWITWHVSITNTRQNVNWNQYLSEINCTNLLKDFFNRFGLLYKVRNGTITLKTIESIISARSTASDWSSKLVGEKPSLDFGLSSFGQSTKYRYTDTDLTEEDFGEGELVIANTILKAEEIKYTTFFESCLTENTTGHLVARLPVYDSTSEISDDIIDEPGIKVLTLKSRTVETAITFDQTARTDYKLAYFLDDALAKDTGWQYFLDQFYPSFESALQKYKLVTKLFYLTENDILNFDPLKLVYDGDAYYLVNEIRNYIPNRITKVTLFKVS